MTKLLVKQWRIVVGGGEDKTVLSGQFVTKRQADRVCATLRRNHPGARVEESA